MNQKLVSGKISFNITIFLTITQQKIFQQVLGKIKAIKAGER